MGVIQGITEFLPVSSSGHLALFHNITGDPVDNLLFDIALHVATLIPVCIILRKEIWAILRKPVQKTTGLLIVGTIPAVIAALLFKDKVEALFGDVRFLMIGFAVTGLLLLYADCVKKRHLTKGIKDMTYIDALVIGAVQAVAIAPSVSRSGSTTAASLFRKVSRKEAAAFVFLLSIPAILGAAALEVKDLLTGAITVTPSDGLNMAFGFVAAALAGYLSIALVFKLIQKARLRYFSFYLFALAAFICVDTFILKGIVFGG
jgi:undecaprenyl-diphosphatase